MRSGRIRGLGYLTPTEFRRCYESIHQGGILK
jgi:hypothetical protein